MLSIDVIPILKLCFVIFIFTTISLVFVVTINKYKFLPFYQSVADTNCVAIKCTLTHSPTR